MPDRSTLPGADPAAADAYRQALAGVLQVAAPVPTLEPELHRCPQFVHGHLLMVLLSLADGRPDDAASRLAKLACRRDAMSRGQRQLTQIVGVAACGHRFRFQALAAEHPDDHDLLTAAEITLAHAPRPTP